MRICFGIFLRATARRLLAEVPCSHVVELAKAQVNANPNCSMVMKQLSRVRVQDAEVGCHSIFRAHGYCAPVPVDTVDLGPGVLKSFPYIKLSNWVAYLMDTDRLPRQLVGVPTYAAMETTLREFWRRYQQLYPNHSIFAAASRGAIEVARCIPVYSHSDEGRSLKHQPLWVLSVHGCLGRGTKAYISRGQRKLPLHRKGMGLNFIGKTWGTQFMFATMLRAVSKEHPAALDKLVGLFADDCAALASEGITSKDGQHHVWLIHLNNKGDLPALAKLASLKRTFSHVPKAASSKKPCTGICHLCLAGQEISGDGTQLYPFEQLTPQPSWLSTLEVSLPWDSEPTILRGHPYLDRTRLAHFFATDIWHNMHLGIAKHWIASSLVSIMERSDDLSLPCGAGASVNDVFIWMTAEFKDFCKRKRVQAHSYDISRETLAFPSSKKCPVGMWSKGSTSTHLMQFLENLCNRFVDGKTEDPLLLAVAPQLKLDLILFHMLVWALGPPPPQNGFGNQTSNCTPPNLSHNGCRLFWMFLAGLSAPFLIHHCYLTPLRRKELG